MSVVQNKTVSMSRRLTLALVFAMTLIVVLVASGFYFYTATELERSFNQKVEETVSYLEGSLGRILWHVDNTTVVGVAETVLQDDLVVGVTIRDEQDKSIYSVREQDGDDLLLRNRSIRYKRELVGEVDVYFSAAPLEDTLTNILLISLSVWLLAIISIAVLTNLFIRKFFQGPLTSFTDLAESYRRNPESPPSNPTPYLEFQPIENVVKNLANEVFLKLRELDAHGKHLETEVAERTQDLQIAKDEAETARAKAEMANQAKSTFLANMSHELRTPLNAILGFSGMIGNDHQATASILEKVAIINRSGEHLLTMINDVLDLSKVEAGHIELEPEAFDLPEMMEDVRRMFDVRTESAQLNFEFEIDPNLCRFIKADLGKLRQVLVNLLGNAVKFTQEGGIALRARTLPITDNPAFVSLQLEVEDCGPGIAAENIDRVFNPFVQAGRSPTSMKGTGLGLSISKSFIELMDGEISLESVPGKGSVFRVELPVERAEAAETIAVDSTRAAVRGLETGQPDWRILVAEDDFENRLLLSGLLIQTGFTVREVENGEQAIRQFEKWQPHFIWMDMRMPVMNGVEATRKIRALPDGETVKIVAITASAFKEQHQSILEAGCDAVVHKPYRAHEIFDTMVQYLDVRYIYDQAKVQLTIATGEVNVDAVAALPLALREKLRIAATSLSEDEYLPVIASIAEIDPVLADNLGALVRDFQFDQVLKLLDDAGNNGD